MSVSLAVALAGVSPGQAGAQSAGVSEPAPSSMIKRTIDGTDPIKLLLDKKKALVLTDTQEDTLKALSKEMRHMQDLVFSEIDKVGRKDADKPRDGGRPSAAVSALVQERISRLEEIQSAYRDRARTFLTPAQIVTADSLEKAKKERGRK